MSPRKRRLLPAALALTLAATIVAAGAAPAGAAHRRCGKPAPQAKVQILAVNDFHGALATGRTLKGADNKYHPIGGAAVLAAYLDQRTQDAAQQGASTIRVGVGDLIGASQPESALLQDEPTIAAFDAMGLECSAIGNHELDEGLMELLRLQHGGTNQATGYFPGADFQYLAANVVNSKNLRPVLPAYDVCRVNGVRVAFIGAVLTGTPTIVTPSGVQGLSFLDEAASINMYVSKLERRGIHTFVVLLHQGGSGTRTGGPITGDVVPIVTNLSRDVDVVCTAHTHNGYWGTIDGKLVTQAYANGTALADIDLVIDKRTDEVVSKTADVVDTWGDVAPGTTPNAAVAKIVADAVTKVAPITSKVVGNAAAAITRNDANNTGESALGDLIADAQRWKGGTDIAFMNPGGIRPTSPPLDR
jgi:5'-nucleotidase